MGVRVGVGGGGKSGTSRRASCQRTGNTHRETGHKRTDTHTRSTDQHLIQCEDIPVDTEYYAVPQYVAFGSMRTNSYTDTGQSSTNQRQEREIVKLC